MASGTYVPPIEETKKVTIKPGKVTLELSEEEANALLEVCYRVGGDPVLSRRRYLDNVVQALPSFHQLGGRKADVMPRCSVYFNNR